MLQDVRNGAKPFCVHKNAANDEYFTTDPEFGNADENNSNTSELNIVRKDSVYAWHGLYMFFGGSYRPCSRVMPPTTAPYRWLLLLLQALIGGGLFSHFLPPPPLHAQTASD